LECSIGGDEFLIVTDRLSSFPFASIEEELFVAVIHLRIIFQEKFSAKEITQENRYS
jgi:hypothetical protein